MTKLDVLKKQYKKAFGRFEEVLQKEKNDIVRDSAIKRFEFTFDLSWKLIKAFLEEKKGIVCMSPKDCFRSACQTGLVDYDDFWLEMTDLRNEIVHAYDEKLAEKLYEKFHRVLECFKSLGKKIGGVNE